MTRDLEHRVEQHRFKLLPGFTSKYNVTRLVWYEAFSDAMQAITAEKRLKGWTRAKKIALIEASNPFWNDLFDRASSPETGKMLRCAQHDGGADVHADMQGNT
jgi:putative endonuclease